MDGILVVNKPKGFTSRDVVNKVSKILNTKKVGHTGTLDPLATGVLVLCIGKATKLVDLITSKEKEYVATAKLGLYTDTLDIEGKILKEETCVLDKEKLINTLNSFKGRYLQEVPAYSAVKIKGKKLYEYSRDGVEVTLPSRIVDIFDIKLLTFEKSQYKFKTTVSKGTYIRSLIRDINNKLNIIGVMSELKRTKQGNFSIENAYSLEDVENNNFELLSIKDVLKEKKIIELNENDYKIIKNGGLVDNKYNSDEIVYIYNDEVIAIYKTYQKDSTKMKPYKMFI